MTDLLCTNLKPGSCLSLPLHLEETREVYCGQIWFLTITAFAKVLIPTGTAGALADTYTQQQECEPLRRLIELRLEKENKSKDTHAAQ